MPTSHGPIESILTIAEGSFHAADLAEGDLVYVEARQTVGDALPWMDTGDIDVAPRREDATRRYVVREELWQVDDLVKVYDVARAMDISRLWTGDVGLGEALELLKDHGPLSAWWSSQ